ncbi:MAG TPA: hypothetical protein VKR52_04475 [Terracidiphilus sp.]|nr:hypothetical protein [Terracidiphilus sp.]
MTTTRLTIIFLFILAFGWSLWFWLTHLPIDPSGAPMSAAEAVQLPIHPPIPTEASSAEELLTDATASIPDGADVTGELDICGNHLCVWDLSNGTPFALLNYCSGT